MSWMSRIACTAPPVAATAALLAFVLTEAASGRTPLAYERPLNIAEAAAMGRTADVLRFARAGADAATIHDVRPEIISSSITRVTAAEAAVWSRRVQVIRALDRERGLGPEEERRRIACLAVDLMVAEIVDYLAPDGVACAGHDTAAAIQARTR